MSSGDDVYREDPSKREDGGKRKLTVDVMRRLIGLVAPYRWRLVFATVMLLGAAVPGLLYPLAAKEAIDAGSIGASTAKIDHLVLGLVALFLVHGALIWLRHYTMSWLGERVVADLRARVFQRVLGLPLAWFHERRTGELVGRLSADVTVIEDVVGSELSMALRNFVQLIGGLGFLFWIDAKLTLMMLVIVPPLIVMTMYFGRGIRKLARAVQDRLGHASGQAQEALGAIQTVQSFVREGHEATRYRDGVEDSFQASVKLFRWRSSFYAGMTAAGYLAVTVVIWLGGRALIHGEITTGQLTSFFFYTLIMAGALAEIAGLWGALQRASGATERLFSIIDTVPDIRDPDGAQPLPAGRGAVRFAGVDFAYPARAGHAVLAGFDLEVAPGEVVALVGPSGAGKSTVLNLLYRFYDVQAGSVTVEGADVRTLALADLRRALAMVAQEPVLFSGTIRDNIRYGKQDATQAEVEAAARDANAHDFITSFPDGYDTVIGERGAKLSGGQKQRVAIARALLADPRVLILDEATSNLDAESEAQVQAALARLMHGRTTIVVAHRLSTVRDADRIAVVGGGKVVELGTHEQLMAKAGVYRRLVEHQVIKDVELAAAG